MTQWFHRIARLAGTPLRVTLIAAIRLYRVSLAGLVGGQCRFSPSCSHYAEEAILEHGAIRGVVMSTWRVLRCNPFGKGGADPVPPGARYDSVIHKGVTA